MNRKKLSPQLALKLDMVDVAERLPIIVRFRLEVVALKAATGDLPVHHYYHLTPSALMMVGIKEIDRLSHDQRVARIWLDLPAHTCLDASVPLLGVPAVWRTGFRGAGIKLAVVDTGVDANHPALVGRVAVRHDITGEGVVDLNGHGTHVAGIIAGAGEKYRGVAPEATLMSVKVLRGDGSGMMSGVMAGVEWAVDRGARVINLSLGIAGASDGSDALSLTCDAAVDRGAVVCVAAGNDGPGQGSVGSPGSARKVITVGASNDEDAVADFSSRGPTSDGRVKPDVVFPGYRIVSCRAKGTSLGRVVDDLYTEASGTSMATPHASGAAALLLQSKPNIAPAQVKELLRVTAKDLGLPANTQGAGRPQVYQAYLQVPSPVPPSEPTLPPILPPPEAIGCIPGLVRSLWPRPVGG